MDAALLVDIGYSTDELCKDFLDLVDRKGAMLEQVVVQLVAYKNQVSYCRLLGIKHNTKERIVPAQYSRTSHTKFSVTITS